MHTTSKQIELKGPACSCSKEYIRQLKELQNLSNQDSFRSCVHMNPICVYAVVCFSLIAMRDKLARLALNRSCTVVAVAYSENLDFVIQRVFNEANFRAETQPFIRHKKANENTERCNTKIETRSNEAMRPKPTL